MPEGRIEIITGRERRRRWDDAAKSRIVSESLEPGARVADVAARHDVSPSLLHGWRRLARRNDGPGSPGVPEFVPVRLAPAGTVPPPAPDSGTAAIEIVLPSGGRVLVRDDVRVSTLRAVLAALRP